MEAFGATCDAYGSEDGYNEFDIPESKGSPFNGPTTVAEYCDANGDYSGCTTLNKFAEATDGKICTDEHPSIKDALKDNSILEKLAKSQKFMKCDSDVKELNPNDLGEKCGELKMDDANDLADIKCPLCLQKVYPLGRFHNI